MDTDSELDAGALLEELRGHQCYNEVCPVELREEQLHEAVLVRCRAERVEPPGRPDRIAGAARALFEKTFCEHTVVRLGQECIERLEALVDALVDQLLALIFKINTRADKKVERELTEDLRRVRGKEGILFRLAQAAVDHPDDTVRTALFPVVGEGTLRDLVREAKANKRAFQARVRTVLHGSYTHHYRRMLPPLLAALSFRCNNTAYQPVMDALDLLARYAVVDGKQRFYAATDRPPIEGVVPPAWRDAVVDENGRIERVPYELCVLVALRDAVRRREVYVEGGHAQGLRALPGGLIAA